MSLCLDTTKQQNQPMTTTTNGTPHTTHPVGLNGKENGAKDHIFIIEDDEDSKAVPSSAKNKLKMASKVEEDSDIIEEDYIGNQMSVIKGLERELKGEENTLLLFQQLKESQKSGPKTSSNLSNGTAVDQKKPMGHAIPNHQTFNPANNNNNNGQRGPSPAVFKVTKQVALSAIDQQFASKRTALKKHLEKAFEKIPLPSPKPNSGLAEIAFVPSSIVTEFSSLIGLEEVCKNIQEYDSNSSKSDAKKVFSPFSCSRCKTDFTPVWKREKPGSNGVVCENCLVGNHKTNLHRDFEQGIRNALTQYSNAEKELEKEYDELVNNPENLETFIKEHEKKLAAQQAVNMNSVYRPNANNGRKSNTNFSNKLVYSNGNGGLNQTAANPFLASNVLQQAQLVAATLGGSNVSQSGNGLTSLSAETLQSLNPVQQAQLISHLQAQAQQQQQQQQLIASLVAAAKSSGNSSNNAVLNTLASTMANQNQHFQQQQLLASVIASIQQQAAVTSSQDQMSQLQNALLGSFMGASSNPQQQRVQQNQNQSRQQQQLQTLLQYSLLQQQAQAAAAAQQQQQQNSANSLSAQSQQLALLQQMLQQSAASTASSATSSQAQQPSQPAPSSTIATTTANSTSAASAANLASFNLLQSLQSLGNAAIKK